MIFITENILKDNCGQLSIREAQWPSGRASDSRARGWGLDPQVLEQDTFTSQKVLVIPRKRWRRPKITEKLFTGKQTRNEINHILSVHIRIASMRQFCVPTSFIENY